MSAPRITLTLLGLAGLLGCLWLIDDRGYQRGWSARDEEALQQAEITAQIGLNTLIRNTAETKEADQRLIDDLRAGLAMQQAIQARARAHFDAQPKDDHAPEVPFAQCRIDPDTRGLLHEAHSAAAAAIGAGGAHRVDAVGHGAPAARP